VIEVIWLVMSVLVGLFGSIMCNKAANAVLKLAKEQERRGQ
jgi:hypothetical protein